jgi:hypothetical protein
MSGPGIEAGQGEGKNQVEKQQDGDKDNEDHWDKMPWVDAGRPPTQSHMSSNSLVHDKDGLLRDVGIHAIESARRVFTPFLARHLMSEKGQISQRATELAGPQTE